MTPVRLLVGRVQWRMRLARALWITGRVFFGMWWVLLLMVLLSKLVPVPSLLWFAAGWAMAGALPLIFLLVLFFRVTPLKAALAIDERLQLCERISTALVLDDDQDPFRRAVRADAERRALQVRAHDVVPLEMPRDVVRSWLPLLLIVAVWFVPPWRVLNEPEKEGRAAAPVLVPKPEQARAVEELARAVRAATGVSVPVEFDRVAREVEQLAEQLRAGLRTERQAMADLGRIADGLERSSEEIARRLAAARSLREQTGGDPLNDVRHAVRRGDFTAAAEKLALLQQKLQQGTVSREQMNDLAKSLAETAHALDASQPALAEALAQAAQDLQQGNPQQAQQALGNAAQEMQNLQELAQQAQQAQQLAQQVSQCASGMCRSSTSSGPTKGSRSGQGSGQGKRDWSQVFNTGPQEGDSQARQQASCGMVAPGQGQGGRAEFAGGPTAFAPDLLPGEQRNSGEILRIGEVKGEQIRGQSQVPSGDIQVERSQLTEEALAKENVPLAYRQYVLDYFNARQAQADGENLTGAAALPVVREPTTE